MPVNNKCPSDATPNTNVNGVVLACVRPPDPGPTFQNEATFTFSSSTPNAYLLTVSGFVGTRSDGTCPAGTTLVPSVTLRPTGAAPALVGPACAFSVSAEKKYTEANHIALIPQGTCTETAFTPLAGPGAPCFFTVTASGTMILKQVPSCTDGTEPATGTDATVAGFPAGSTYVCNGNVLGVDNIPLPQIPIDLTAENGYFVPSCYPSFLLTTPTPLPTPTQLPNPLFPTRTPTPTPAVPSATATPAGSSLVCGFPGQSTTQAFTTLPGAPPPIITYSGSVAPTSVLPGHSVTATANIAVNGFPAAGVPLYVLFHFGSGDVFCGGQTTGTGVASCTVTVPTNAPPGPVSVQMMLINDCQEYDIPGSFQVQPAGTPTPTATIAVGTATPIPTFTAQGPTGICVVPAGYGDLVVTAAVHSSVNTQPPLSSGPVKLGNVAMNTPTSLPTTTPIPLAPTETPVPTPTFTPTATPIPTITPTPTITPSPTITPTRTPVPTPTPVPLRYTVDAARVSHVNNLGNMQGLDEVHRGDPVWLMLYYTVLSIPHTESGTSTYEILQGGRTIMSASFSFNVGPPPRSYSRVDPYVIPNNLSYGVYTFRASIRIDSGPTLSAQWQFAVVRAPQQGP